MKQQNNQPRNINGRATARADAANRPGGDVFECPMEGCGRSFTTKTGLGVHMNRAHKDDFDRLRNAEEEGKQ